MTYDTRDRSVADSEPIECFKFEAPHKTWYLTSYNEAVTVDGDLYEPTSGLTHTAFEVSSVLDSLTTVDFKLPSSHELARHFCFGLSPRFLLITVKTAHKDDLANFKVEFTGRILGTGAEGEYGVIKTGSITQTELDDFLSSVFYQKTCNHVLFDERCKVLRATFTQTAIVVKIQGQIITVDDMVFAADELILGEMTNTRTGEKVGIVSNAANVIGVGFRFFDLIVGDTVELTQGCNHLRLGHCKTRFNNVDNYGGFDFTPEVNPFEELDFTARTIVTIKTKKTYEKIWKPPTAWGGG